MFLTIGLLDLGAAAFWCVFASGDGIDDKVRRRRVATRRVP